jgi:hypothetical protein
MASTAQPVNTGATTGTATTAIGGTAQAQVQHDKTARARLSEDERAKLFKKAANLAHKRYDIVP